MAARGLPAAVLAVLLLPAVAMAHAELISSDPAANASLAEAPDALTMTGNPISRAMRSPAAASETGGEPGMIGSPLATAALRAETLSPTAASTAGGGPTKARPADSTARAKSARSERKP